MIKLIILGIVIIVFSLILFGLAVWFDNDGHEVISLFVSFVAIVFMVTGLVITVAGLTNFDIEGRNRETFAKLQQEYIVINQYIKSSKSDSILESTDMMKRLTDYNNTVIEKQNDMTRPIRKYFAIGVDWNELELIDLEKIIEEENLNE